MERRKDASGPTVPSAFHACSHISSHPPSSQGRGFFADISFVVGVQPALLCSATGWPGGKDGHGRIGSGRSWAGGCQPLLSCLPLGLGRFPPCQDLTVCGGPRSGSPRPLLQDPNVDPRTSALVWIQLHGFAPLQRVGREQGLRVLPVGAQQMHLCQHGRGRSGSTEGSSFPACPGLPEGPGGASLVEGEWQMPR